MRCNAHPDRHAVVASYRFGGLCAECEADLPQEPLVVTEITAAEARALLGTPAERDPLHLLTLACGLVLAALGGFLLLFVRGGRP